MITVAGTNNTQHRKHQSARESRKIYPHQQFIQDDGDFFTKDYARFRDFRSNTTTTYTHLTHTSPNKKNLNQDQ